LRYFASYTICDPITGNPARLPVGALVDADGGYDDTVFLNVDFFSSDEDGDLQVASLRVRRVMVDKIINESRSVFVSMDQIDQLEHEAWAAVWDPDSDHYRFEDAMFGDLLIFEDMHLIEGAVLWRFNVNKILDDIVNHVAGGAAVAVFAESYASLTAFNVDACEYLEGVGYARVLSKGGLEAGRGGA